MGPKFRLSYGNSTPYLVMRGEELLNSPVVLYIHWHRVRYAKCKRYHSYWIEQSEWRVILSRFVRVILAQGPC